MNWYDRLNEYFPIEEMKSRKHMELLLEDKNDIYLKDESVEHVMIYAEFDTCVFVDYLWVAAETRGQGTGHKLMEKLKQKNKLILLEVEPVNPDELDTARRLHFYQREGFRHAKTIKFQNHSFQTDEIAPLEILYWSTGNQLDVYILQQMKMVYNFIHKYKSIELYGREFQTADKILQIDETKNAANLLRA